MFRARILLLALGCLLSSAAAQAQVLYGTLLGTVEDSTGALVQGAAVTATSTDTGRAYQVLTNEAGLYRFADLLPGTYRVSAGAPGFSTFAQAGVSVTINTVTRVDVRLRVGEISETVTVVGEARALQTDKADVHAELRSKEITDLPLPLYRNYQSLINLVPGATPARTQNATIGSPGRALSTNINGTTRNNNNSRLDGASNIRFTLPHQTHYVPPAETIETVNISTNNFDAEQGFAGGAAINVVTKSGANQFHGVLFEHHSDSSLRAKNFFYRGARKPKNINNIFGGTLGGPIRKDKVFFFAGWERLRERENVSRLMTVATADQRAGDFRAYGVSLYDPLTGSPDGSGRTAFPNAAIPLGRQSAISRKMQALIPAANQSGFVDNYFASKPSVFDRDNYDAKVNWNWSANTSLWAKYSAMQANVVGQFALDQAGGEGMLPQGGAGRGEVLAQVATLGGTHVFSPNFLVDGIIGFTRMAVQDRNHDIGNNFGLNTLGIPGTNGPDPRQGGLPHFSFNGYASLGQTETWMPKILFDNTWTYTVNAGWTKGRHDIRFGMDIAREQEHHWHPEQGSNGPRGRLWFEGGVTALRGGPAPNQYNSWAAFLLGQPQRVGKSLQFFDPMSTREWRHGYYFRDRWQATRRLTLSLGLRWEYFPIMTRANSGIERYDSESNKVFVGRFGGVPDTAGVSAGKRDFAPRVGVAYRIGQGTVVRGGYGISVDPYPMSTYYLGPYPSVINADFAGGNSFLPFGPIENGIPLFGGPDLRQGVIDMPADVTTQTLERGLFNRGYVQSFNVVVERQLPWNMVGSAGYVGTRTVDQLGSLNINASPPGGGRNGRPLVARFGRAVDTTVFRNFLPSSYDSLQAKLDRRFQGGLLMRVAYTWGKAIDWTDDSSGGLSWNIASQLQRNRALAGFDRPHIFRFAWVAELPFGAGKRWANTGGLGRAVLGGWQVNGTFSSYSGTPFTVGASGTSLDAPGNTQTADQVKSEVKKLGGVGPGMPFFDPMAFAPVTGVRFGATGRNILRGPGVANLDLSVFRNFSLRERWKLQFRSEAFNFTNTPHFDNPAANVSAGGFMTISRTASTDSNLEGQERQIRFSLRLSF